MKIPATVNVMHLFQIIIPGCSLLALLVFLADGIQFILRQRWPVYQAGRPPIVCLARLKYIGSLGFFMAPYHFLHEAHASFEDFWLQFSVRNYRVLAVFGEEARDTFFTNKNLSLHDGYGLLNPSLRNLSPEERKKGADTDAWFVRKFVRTDFLEPSLANMLSDSSKDLDPWGSQGVMDPFVSLHKLVFQAVTRFVVGNELANDPRKIETVVNAFHHLQKGSTPASLLFPWFPTPARVRRIFAGFTLYRIISKAIKSRRQTGEFHQDILQTLLDETEEQLDDTRIMKLLLLSIFAAGTNTAPILAWLHIYMDQNAAWKAQVVSEMDSFLAENTGSSSSFLEALMVVPLGVWEHALPTLEKCLEETIRLRLIGALLRRNVGEDIMVGSHTIHRDDFVICMSENAHLNESIYPNPHCFDPSRSHHDGHAERLGFLGWGAGHHPCTGQRLAKIMTKIISVLILSRFTLEAIDVKGQRLTKVPKTINQLSNIGLPAEPVYFRYTAR
ncbi:cytochrome P450 [Gautieria morchelliformis]|nr:cytochrome P450 [Gautieria morchelliformis]